MHQWTCDQCIADPEMHAARGHCGLDPFPTDPFVYELGVEVDVDKDGRSCVEGSAITLPLPGWLAAERFYECPLVGMEHTFGPLVRLYSATKGGLGLSPEQLGYRGSLASAGVSALLAIADAVNERDLSKLPKAPDSNNKPD